MAVWNWNKTQKVEGTGLMSYDMLNSTQNIPCIGYGATANRKGGGPELEFEKPVFIVDFLFHLGCK